MFIRNYVEILSKEEKDELREYEKKVKKSTGSLKNVLGAEKVKEIEETLIEYNRNYSACIALGKEYESLKKQALDVVKKHREARTTSEANTYIKQYHKIKANMDVIEKENAHYFKKCALTEKKTLEYRNLVVNTMQQQDEQIDFEKIMNKFRR